MLGTQDDGLQCLVLPIYRGEVYRTFDRDVSQHAFLVDLGLVISEQASYRIYTGESSCEPPCLPDNSLDFLVDFAVREYRLEKLWGLTNSI